MLCRRPLTFRCGPSRSIAKAPLTLTLSPQAGRGDGRRMRGVPLSVFQSYRSPGGVTVRRASLTKGRGTIFARFIIFWYFSSRIA